MACVVCLLDDRRLPRHQHAPRLFRDFIETPVSDHSGWSNAQTDGCATAIKITGMPIATGYWGGRAWNLNPPDAALHLKQRGNETSRCRESIG